MQSAYTISYSWSKLCNRLFMFCMRKFSHRCEGQIVVQFQWFVKILVTQSWGRGIISFKWSEVKQQWKLAFRLLNFQIMLMPFSQVTEVKEWSLIALSLLVLQDSSIRLVILKEVFSRSVYIVTCQRGGVSNVPPWLQAATRHGARDPLVR